MGAQWKQKWRELTSNKKGQVVGKLVREIQVAVQQGGVDPDMNPRLYAALEKADKNWADGLLDHVSWCVPKDRLTLHVSSKSQDRYL